ncbi:MAG TPA: permease, partial [Kofleriaceae bacterium]|nr:permease [Kofleriaceae bacterium]
YVFLVPELGLDTITLTAHLFGWQLTLLRVGTAVLAALLAGFAMGRRWPVRQTPFKEPVLPQPRWRDALDEVTIHSMPWLVAGAVCAAFASLALAGQPLAFVDNRALQTLAVVAIAIPSYICAPAATPLAGTLVAHGLAPEAALAGLVLGAMANIATIRFLQERFGRSAVLVAFAPVVIVVFAATNLVSFTDLRHVASAHSVAALQGQATSGWLNYAAVGGLAVLMLHSLWRFGFSAWLEPIVGNEHAHHHQHGEDEECSDGCHHDEAESDEHGHGHGHGHGHEHGHGHGHGHEHEHEHEHGQEHGH